MCYLVVLLEVRVIGQERLPGGFVSDGGVVGSIGFGAFPDVLSAFFEMFPLRTTSLSSSSHSRGSRRRKRILFSAAGFEKSLRESTREGGTEARQVLFLSSYSLRALLMGLRVLV